jgi:hypothetical protein
MQQVTDRETLVAALRKRGVDWLAPGDAQGEPVSDDVLISSLAVHEDSRLRAALTGLFLLQARPNLADYVPPIVALLPTEARHELMARYTAAVYLQHLWRTRLNRFLGHFENLPDLFSKELGLPNMTDGFGKSGLYALADWHKARSRIAYNRLSEYSRQIEFVLAALEMREYAIRLTASSQVI